MERESNATAEGSRTCSAMPQREISPRTEEIGDNSECEDDRTQFRTTQGHILSNNRQQIDNEIDNFNALSKCPMYKSSLNFNHLKKVYNLQVLPSEEDYKVVSVGHKQFNALPLAGNTSPENKARKKAKCLVLADRVPHYQYPSDGLPSESGLLKIFQYLFQLHQAKETPHTASAINTSDLHINASPGSQAASVEDGDTTNIVSLLSRTIGTAPEPAVETISPTTALCSADNTASQALEAPHSPLKSFHHSVQANATTSHGPKGNTSSNCMAYGSIGGSGGVGASSRAGMAMIMVYGSREECLKKGCGLRLVPKSELHNYEPSPS